MTWWKDFKYKMTEEEQMRTDLLCEQVAREIRVERLLKGFPSLSP